MRITVVGAGYVGVVIAACFGKFGHRVNCLDADAEKISGLLTGNLPIFEPGLAELVDSSAAGGNLHFTSSYADAISGADAIFISVGTPADSEVDGNVDLSQLRAAIEQMVPHLRDGVTVVVKSTVPVGTTRQLGKWIAELRPGIAVEMATNPEFLRQGSAVEDFMEPDRLIIGTGATTTEQTLREVYRPLIDSGVPTVFTNFEAAELIKYASNAFLAIKLSFINEIADLCEASGASVESVAKGIGLDRRIAPGYLVAGPGFGGSCLPKDVQGLLNTSDHHGTRSTIVAAALEVNEGRHRRMVEKIVDALPRPLDESRVAVLGLTFKADTDDLRSSPAIAIVNALAEAGASVGTYDPRGMERARGLLLSTVEIANNPYEAMRGADCLVIATEWDEFAELDLGAVRDLLASPIIVDLRNLYVPEEVARAGFRYVSIGRP